MTKFTKGPWVAKGSTPSRIYGMVRKDKESMVAATGSVNADSGANAHLIASAPDMYKILEGLYLNSGLVYGEDYDKIEELLTKARGE